MYCTQCKAELPEDAKFCSNCGHSLKATVLGQKKSPSTGFLLLAGIVVVLLAMWGISSAANRNRPPVPRTYTDFVVQAPQVPLPQPHVLTIVNTAVTVAAHSYSWYTFSLPERSVNVSVQGHFAATGGMGNDIQVYILNPDEFANFQNHHTTPTFYNSQRETQNSISAVLPAGGGTYYLVLDNGFSLITPKAVQISAVLNYTN